MKPIKLGESRTYTVEGTEVVLTRVEPTFFSYNYGDQEHRTNEQKSRYAVTVEGKLRGHIQVNSGFGNPWHISALGTTRHWAGEWERDRPVSVYSSSIKRSDVREDRDGMVLHVPRLIADGSLPTVEEIEAGKADAIERQRQRKEEEETNRARWAKEREEAAAAQAAARKDVYDTLLSMRERLQTQMTNYEVEIVTGIMEQYK